MKDLILQPPIFLGILCFCVIYFIIFFKFTKNKRFLLFFETLALYIFTFSISGANFFPLDRLDPGDIGDHAKGFFSGLLLLVVYGTFFILFRGKGKQLLSNFFFLFRQPFLGLYLGLIVFSVFWSDNPPITLKATFGLFFFSLFAVHFARKYNWQELSTIFRWNSLFIALYSIFSALFIPSIGICRKGWCGGFGHPIDLGVLMAMGASLWMLNALFNRRYRLRSCLGTILCIVVMQFANSAGAFLVFATLAIVVLTTTFLKRLNFTQAFIFFVLLLFSFGATSVLVIANFDNFLSFFDKDITLTGRIPLWTLLVQDKVTEHPWFGYGYNAFWQRWRGNDSPAADIVSAIVGNGRDWVSHAHNGFLDIVLNIGLIGLLIFVILFFINIFQTIKLIINSRRSDSFLPLIILTFVFMTNLSNSPIMIPSLVWFQFIIVSLKVNVVQSEEVKTTLLNRDKNLSKTEIPFTPTSANSA